MMHSVDYASIQTALRETRNYTYRFLFPHNKYVCVYNVIIINSLLIESIVRSIIGDHPSHDQTIISRDIRGALTSPKTVSVYSSTCTVSERYIFSLLTIANDVAILVDLMLESSVSHKE